MTFAITGANGFLGVHIIHHLLCNGHNVLAISRPGASSSEFERVAQSYDFSAEENDQLTWCYCELYDVDGLQEIFTKADYVMQLAGTISYLQRDYEKMLLVNQEYTANVVNACLGSDIKKLLYCSSIAAITKTNNGDTVREDIEWNNEVAHSNYGYTKHLGEYELWRGREEGLATVVINPGIILGYGDWSKGSNKLFENATNEFPFYSNGMTGWVGVKDVARIAEKLCLSDIVGERFVVVSENKSFRDIAFSMADAMGKKPPRIEIKGWLYKLAYAVVSVKELLGLRGILSKETVRASVAVNYFDNSKVRAALGFEFQRMDEVVKEAVS